MNRKTTPYVGETVLFVPAIDDEEVRHNGADIVPGIITRVWDGGMVNLAVIPDCLDKIFTRTSICHIGSDMLDSGQGYWKGL